MIVSQFRPETKYEKPMKKIAYTICSVILLTACAAGPQYAPTAVPRDRLPLLGNIGVISLMADEFRIHYVGGGKLANRYNKADVKEWHIDEHVIEVARNYMQAKGYTTKDLSYDAGSLFNVYTRAKTNTDKRVKKIRVQLQELGAQHNIDTFVLFYRGYGPDFIGQSAEPVWGYGVYNQRQRGYQIAQATYVVIDADVVDAKSGELLAAVSDKFKLEPKEEIWHWTYEERNDGIIPLGKKGEPTLKEMTLYGFSRAVENALAHLGFYTKISSP